MTDDFPPTNDIPPTGNSYGHYDERYAASQPTGGAVELVAIIGKHLKGRDVGCTSDELHCRAADALTAQAARIAELEVDRNEALNAAVESSEIAGEACIKAHDATTRAKRLEALIRPIAQLAVMGDEKSDPRWKDAPKGDEDIIQVNISLGQLRAMRAALSEGGD